MNDNGKFNDTYSPFDDVSLASDYTLAELREMAREQEIDVSLPSIQRAIAKRHSEANRANPPSPPKAVVMFNNAMLAIGHAIVLLFMLVISNIALPLSIGLLAYGEQQRVSAGIGMFDPARANLLSTVVIIFYVGLLVVYSDKVGQQEITRDKFSLRLLARKLRYFVGIGRFQREKITTLDLLQQSLKLCGVLIIVLGTAGSLQEEIAVSGTWRTAIVSLFWESDMLTFISLIGGLFLTAGLLFGLRFIVDFEWQRFKSILPEGESFFMQSGELSPAAEQAEKEYLLFKIRQKQQQQ